MTVGDFDGDGRADIFVCPPVGSGGACFAMYSTGNGFSYGNSTFYPQWAGSTLTAGDFNGDGRTDIFVCPPVGSGGACFAMYSTGNGFSYGNSSFYPQWAGSTLTTGDFDGDGKMDFSTVFAEGFDHALDGIAAGVIARKGNVWVTDGAPEGDPL